MYHMPHFKEPDRNELITFMQQYPFVTLIGVNDLQQAVATQVPVFTDERDGKIYITGHIMRKTDHHRAFEQNPQVLALFTGPHAYVSASWYNNPHQANTWNYMTVQARSTLRYLAEEHLHELLKRTTNHFEKNQAHPSFFEQLENTYVADHIKAIVAFEMEVESLEHVFKLSQNRDEKSYDTIVNQLGEQGGQAAELSAIMKARKHKVHFK
jgi:transcriptional regulator